MTAFQFTVQRPGGRQDMGMGGMGGMSGMGNMGNMVWSSVCEVQMFKS